ncbi:hypothetical protein OUZ56_012369 [Daphnia magna]|uniref:Uncharacterized protein n=1 Tax=Daphnia magna TaxID=35525 RepID=A0ABQ9Z2Z4_9CRUS|nr:hypothetical protein OUZ56_012369 [Daphnia magna]
MDTCFAEDYVINGHAPVLLIPDSTLQQKAQNDMLFIGVRKHPSCVAYYGQYTAAEGTKLGDFYLSFKINVIAPVSTGSKLVLEKSGPSPTIKEWCPFFSLKSKQLIKVYQIKLKTS